MTNPFFDSETVREEKALPAELQTMYQRLSHDGAVWQAASANRLASLAQSLVDDIERIASESLLVAPANDSAATTTPGALPTTMRPPRRRRKWIAGVFAVVAAVVVVGLLALVLQGALTGRETHRNHGLSGRYWTNSHYGAPRRATLRQSLRQVIPRPTSCATSVSRE
jgi:hypothetical protein